jgi:hypothetical protein
VGGQGTNKFNLYLTTKNTAKLDPIPNLYGGGGKVLPKIGDLLDMGDDRIEGVTLVSDISAGTNVSYSFNPVTMTCSCCGKFSKNTQIWVFADQNFPSCLPNPDGKQCVKIVRLENGDLQTLVSRFLAKHGNAIGKNDVILLASATQLLREGVAGYIDSILETMDRIKNGIRKNCLVLPAPFVLLGGCTDSALV